MKRPARLSLQYEHPVSFSVVFVVGVHADVAVAEVELELEVEEVKWACMWCRRGWDDTDTSRHCHGDDDHSEHRRNPARVSQ